LPEFLKLTLIVVVETLCMKETQAISVRLDFQGFIGVVEQALGSLPLTPGLQAQTQAK
jgi:hypothetical protein